MTSIDIARIRTDGGTQPRAQIDWIVVSDYAEAMASGAQFPPVVVYHDGADYWLADGFHRLDAARKAGREQIAADIRQGTQRDAILHSVGANDAHGLRRTNEDKRRAVLRLLEDAEWQGWSDNAIAKQCGVSQPFVSGLRSSYNDYKIERTVTRNGTTYTQNTANIGKPAPAAVEVPQPRYIFPDTPVEKFSVEEWPAFDEEPTEPLALPSVEVLPVAPVNGKMAVHYSSESPEHYTPTHIIAAVVECLGQIDIDPCSPGPELSPIPAAHCYTVDDDGLAQVWQGRVYMNPPYGREIGDWVDKLCQEHTTGNVAEAIALVPSRTDTEWWRKLRDYPVCLVAGRLKFGEAENSAPFPSAIFYLGCNIESFYGAFSAIGDIWQRIEPGMFGE